MSQKSQLGPCPICRSSKYSKTSDGFLICQNGHQSQVFVEEVGDVAQGNVFRVARKGKKGLEISSSQQLSQLYSQYEQKRIQEKATLEVDKYFIFESFQLILKMQLTATLNLIRIKIDDAFFEYFSEVVKEFWIIYITLLETKYPSWNGTHHRNDNNNNNNNNNGENDSDHNEDDDDDKVVGDTYNKRRQPRKVTSEDENELLDPELFNDDDRHYSLSHLKFHLRSLIGILYISCFYLKLPVILADFRRWIIDGKIPYLAAYLDLPASSVDKLKQIKYFGHLKAVRPAVRSLLSIPSFKKLSNFVIHFVRALNEEFNVRFPLPCTPRIVFRMISSLSLPAHFYQLSLKTVEFIDMSSSMRDVYETPGLFCSGLMAVIVCMVKLFFGLNESNNDLIRKNFFEKYLPFFEDMRLLWFEKSLLSEQMDPWNIHDPSSLSKGELDNYLRFCKDHIIRSSTFKESKFPNTLVHLQSLEENLFNLSSSTKIDCPWANYANMALSEEYETSPLKVPTTMEPFTLTITNDFSSTQRYISYNRFDVKGEFHAGYYDLLRAGSNVAGCSINILQKLVKRVEDQIIQTCQVEEGRSSLDIKQNGFNPTTFSRAILK